MSAPNGHAGSSSSNRINGSESLPSNLNAETASRLSNERIVQIVAALELPFDASVIEWRVTNTAKDKARGQVIPYADQRAYTDRLNQVFTPAGWTRKYEVHTSANFERSKDQKTAAKILVTCELTIFGLGCHAATGEEWADDDNAGTAAEAQAFKRACSCFGLGRYLYYFTGVWVDLDARKRPKTNPKLPLWATPDGWRQGLRPQNTGRSDAESSPVNGASGQVSPTCTAASDHDNLVRQIEAMARPLGRTLYRGILKSIARAWNPTEIQDLAIAQRVLENMQGAQRGLDRLHAALEKVGSAPLAQILTSQGIQSLERVDSLETLKQIVLFLEALTPHQ